jgi:hypothetical protein
VIYLLFGSVYTIFVQIYCTLQGKDQVKTKGKKISLLQAVKAPRVARGQGCHIFQTISSQMAVGLSKAIPVTGREGL